MSEEEKEPNEKEEVKEEPGTSKVAAIAKAKAAAAKAKAAKKKEEEEKPKEPSKNQPYLDKVEKLIKDALGEESVEEAYINELSKEVPTLVIKNERWYDVAELLKTDTELSFDYLSGLIGVDYEDRMEVVYHFYSFPNRQSITIKVKTERDNPSVHSIVDLWNGADWNEREAYDLLGIQFPGHPNLKRILLPDDWEGHPLRKDYEPFDEEV